MCGEAGWSFGSTRLFFGTSGAMHVYQAIFVMPSDQFLAKQQQLFEQGQWGQLIAQGTKGNLFWCACVSIFVQTSKTSGAKDI